MLAAAAKSLASEPGSDQAAFWGCAEKRQNKSVAKILVGIYSSISAIMLQKGTDCNKCRRLTILLGYNSMPHSLVFHTLRMGEASGITFPAEIRYEI